MEVRLTCSDGVTRLQLSTSTEHLQSNLAALHQELGAQILAFVRVGFEKEASPDGAAWTPLKRATVRRRKGNAHPILRVQGDLYRSITVKADMDRAIVGTNWAYATIHQYGGTITRAAGATKLHFRRIGRGAKKGQVRFTRANDKRAKFGMATAAHSIRIPARPYLFQKDGDIPEAWKQALVEIVKRHLGV